MKKQHDKTGFLRRSPLVALLALMLAGLLMLSGCEGALTPIEPTDTKEASDTQPGTDSGTGPATTTPDKPNPDNPNPDNPNPDDPNPDNPNPDEPVCENHTGDFLCKTCGKRIVPDGFFAGMFSDSPLTLVAEDIEISAVSISYLELQVTVTNGELIGRGYADITANGINAKATCVLKNGGLYIYADGTLEDMEGLSETDNAAGSSDSVSTGLYISIPGLLIPEFGEGTFTQLYMQIVSMLGQLQELLPALRESLADAPAFDDFCARIAESMFTLKKTDNGYEIALSFEKLSALNDRFSTMTIAELVDALLGEGTFDMAAGLVSGMLDMTLNDLLAQAAAAGINIDDLLAAIEVQLPDVEEVKAVFEQIRTLLKDETVKAQPLWKLLPSTSGEGNMTEAEYAVLKQQITTTIGALKEMTVWKAIADLVSMVTPGEGSDVNGGALLTDAAGADVSESLHDLVKAYLELLRSCAGMTVRLDQDGKLTDMELSVEIPGMVKLGKVQLLAGHTSDKDYDGAVSKVQEKIDMITKDNILDLIRGYFENHSDTYTLTVFTYDEETGILHLEYTAKECNFVTEGDRELMVEWIVSVTKDVDLGMLCLLQYESFDADNVMFVVEYAALETVVSDETDVKAYWLGESDEMIPFTEDEMETYGVAKYVYGGSEKENLFIFHFEFAYSSDSGESD